MHIFYEFPNLVGQCYYDESAIEGRKLLAEKETLVELTGLLINLVEIPGY